MNTAIDVLTTVLVYESHAAHRRFVTSNLENRGFSLINAESLSQIRQMLVYKPAAMVLGLSYLDIESGALHDLALDPIAARIPALLLTTSSPCELFANAIMPPNIKRTLVKPISVERLLSAVQQILA